MKCGKCKGGHATVAEVRACYDQDARNFTASAAVYHPAVKEHVDERDREAEEQLAEEREAAAALDRLAGNTPSTNIDPPSDSQVSYALDLLAGHEWPDAISEEDLRGMARRQVSKLITALQSMPLKPREFAVNVTDHIPAGRYALQEDDVVRFYQVDKPEEGKWAGRVFVKQLIGAPGHYQKNRVSGMREARVLTAIGEDPKASAILYGKESNECGRCHSPLTDTASRARGMGPKCARKSGWF